MKYLIYVFGIMVMFNLVNAAITDNIVAYWKYDGDTTDSTGDYNATNNGATYNAGYGHINGGYSYDGTDYMSTTLNMNGYSEFTFNAWVYADETMGQNTGIIYSRATNVLGMMHLYVSDTIRCYAGQGSQVTTEQALNNAQWYMVTCTYDGSSLKIYVNGVINSTTSSISGNVNCNDIVYHGWDDYTALRRYKGYIDEPSIWSRDLTSSEITTLYNSGTGLQYPFTVGVTTPTFIGVADGDPYSISNVCNIMGVSSC